MGSFRGCPLAFGTYFRRERFLLRFFVAVRDDGFALGVSGSTGI